MKAINIREFRAHAGHLDKFVEQSGEVIITRHGKPILRILPIQAKCERPDHSDLRKKMPLLKKSSADYVRKDRDER
jgi:prevent-host-death family protein